MHVSRRHRLNRFTDSEFRAGCASRLGVNARALPGSLLEVACPDCKARITDLTAHATSCGSINAQPGRTLLHSALEVANRTLHGELDPTLVVTNSRDAYPTDHGFEVNSMIPEAINHHADAGVYDTTTGQKILIDFTFTNAAGKLGVDGAEPGHHADLAEDKKLRQYAKEFPGFSQKSSVALVIISMEHHGSWSKSTRAYWDDRVSAAHKRQTTTMEFPTPLSVITRRVLQTLAVALWRINASRIMQFHRRACYGAQRVGDSTEAEALAVGPGDGS